ncbi:hypothetical protein [Dyella sp. 2HG41-7]|uniref:hypothetical protein n=1 Tax=Dyella sp. 2HG41-7 TaxID=2883239 RepID=UPI001F34E10A|nr:hypothetical protein [Dyella sp. 2HG41-7]
MSTSVVAVLMLHNQSCSQCRMGEPCAASERIQDEWLRRETIAKAGTSAPHWPTEDAA